MATGIPTTKSRRPEEQYSLAYAGKLPADEVLDLPASEPVIVDCGTRDGRLYFGDSLGILQQLRKDPDIYGRVRCIYIDPPYSKSMRFIDRRQRQAYDDTLGGAAYIEFLRRRLILLRDILAQDGCIFVHLDQKMVFEIKLTMDEVFGRENFRNCITRKKCNTKNYTRKKFGNVSDHVLFYSKTDRFVWHRPYDPWSEKRVLEEYPYLDDVTGRRYKRVPLHAPGTRRGATGKPWRDMLPPPGKHWQYPPAKLEELDKAGEIYWSPNGNPRRKVFFDPGKGVPVQDIWLEFKDAHNQNIKITGYPTEKNFDLLVRLIAATTNPGDWVVDCFCGSGTTLEAARMLGRRFVGIDSSRPAIEATVKRLTVGRESMGSFVKSGRNKCTKRHAPGLFEAFDAALQETGIR